MSVSFNEGLGLHSQRKTRTDTTAATTMTPVTIRNSVQFQPKPIHGSCSKMSKSLDNDIELAASSGVKPVMTTTIT